MGLSINGPIKLPCGLELKNRLVKAAMAEAMAESNHLPDNKFVVAYNKWAEGGWGAILTGNIQVDVRHLGGYRDLATDPSEDSNKREVLDSWRLYADTCQRHGTPAIAQISHPGRQSLRGAGSRGILAPTIAPSSIPLHLGDGLFASFIRSLVFGTPREMSSEDISEVIRQFVNSARILADCGFAGVELHAAHGFLLSQFVSSATNKRRDDYGGTPEKHMRLILDIVKGIREVVPRNFCIGIKFNSTEDGSPGFEESMQQVELLIEAGIDFLEISGGTFEDPVMMISGSEPEKQGHKSQRTAAREAFFWDYAIETRKRFPNLILMLTGGFRSREGINAALENNVCDLIGIGRPAVIYPDFPRLIMDGTRVEHEARVSLNKVEPPALSRFSQIKAFSGGAETRFYSGQIRRMATGLPVYAPT